MGYRIPKGHENDWRYEEVFSDYVYDEKYGFHNPKDKLKNKKPFWKFW